MVLYVLFLFYGVSYVMFSMGVFVFITHDLLYLATELSVKRAYDSEQQIRKNPGPKDPSLVYAQRA